MSENLPLRTRNEKRSTHQTRRADDSSQPDIVLFASNRPGKKPNGKSKQHKPAERINRDV